MADLIPVPVWAVFAVGVLLAVVGPLLVVLALEVRWLRRCLAEWWSG